MLKKPIIPTILFVCALIFSLFMLVGEKNKQTNENNNLEENIIKQNSKPISNIILFYGDGCPHCKIVDQYIEENKIKSKLTFAEKEIYSSKENANLLIEKANICKIPNNTIGVPFLWDGTKCYMGDEDIINFFKLKING
ncbi:MAG: hypothetical protein PHZ07_01070 [Patescibacteria group bacterium]|nr:hypothetical protein [Patescibacteria group bacterium]MDD4303971.1 hypothetical protein [Patescibacteria group bacterium]MDD4695040.1 hypothetical protein [Patescibacteria group bacterium]